MIIGVGHRAQCSACFQHVERSLEPGEEEHVDEEPHRIVEVFVGEFSDVVEGWNPFPQEEDRIDDDNDGDGRVQAGTHLDRIVGFLS